MKHDLMELAGRYASDLGAPVATVAKEILHYEILYAMSESGALDALVFQGGTALRLCHQGARYSEDLDFVGGADWTPGRMPKFINKIRSGIAEAYGLTVEVDPPSKEKLERQSGVSVARWRTKIVLPDRVSGRLPRQVINIEVAAVPAHMPALMPVATNYRHLSAPLRQMLIFVEPMEEILADKIVALGARDFLKARDIWDIRFLLDKGVRPNLPLVRRKIDDYKLDLMGFCEKLELRAKSLLYPETEQSFKAEMIRFVDARPARLLTAEGVVRRYLDTAADLGRTAAAELRKKGG
ncbi:MAG TPA: nucleotidyl transferase AbiEii/AbiGii toxin family protein [Rhodospirillaceae bacterium]|nr:nucleotidyl transferase AbiEii/AbiGii toxin family protein [Rhodospirillaceae bacterium]